MTQIGLLLLAYDLLGARRIWPALNGLMVAVWSRQLTILYAVPLLIVAWPRRRVGLVIAGLTLIVAPLLVLNYLKFGNPFESGYGYVYENRHDWVAQRYHMHGLFSLHF